jgi:predicted small metal-binding protein
MKVFILEFSFFCGVNWKNVDFEITAISMEELEESVKKELENMHSNMCIEEKWNLIKKNVVEKELTFPIVVQKGNL